MTSFGEVLFIHESDLVNRGNGFILKDCPHWELYATILLELTDLLDDTPFFIFIFKRN